MYNAQLDNYYNNKTTYKVGIYVRLSREDEDKNGESESIQNQKEYASNYAINQGWNIVDYYCDDGFTGTNFDRPGFKKLIQDIENGRINLVLTKDMSRLGRDYIDTGYYIEKYFPERRVRYVAINDGIDTFSNNSNNDMSPFRSVINDMYAKDISKKVRTVMDTKRLKGEYIGAFATYGYKKDPENKNKLIIDEEASQVVSRIFDLYTTGCGITKISHILNDEGILCPGAYKKLHNPTYNNPKTKLNLWTAHTIKSILNNSTYCGDLSQGKVVKINYKLKKHLNVPKDKWIIAEDQSPAIIEKEVYELVQNMLNQKKSLNFSGNKAEHLLTGLIYCGDCGERLTFLKTQKGIMYCICSKYKRFKMCTRHSIEEKVLEDYIAKDLRRIAAIAIDEEKLIAMVQDKPMKSSGQNVIDEIGKADKRLDEIKKTIKSLYEDKLKGILSETDFIDLSKEYNLEREKLNKLLLDLNKKAAEFKDSESELDNLKKMVMEFKNFKELNRAVLIRLISKVQVFEDKTIVIHYKFKAPFR